MTRLALAPRVKVYLSSAEMEGVFGGGKWVLLDAVRTEGSIQGAAARLGRSYRKAWGDIKRAEEGLGTQLVVAARGGTGGGRATLTEFAEDLLEAWDRFRASVVNRTQEAFAEEVLPVLEGPARSSEDDGFATEGT